MGRVVNVCISEKKGTQKHPIDEGEFIVEFGVKDDAHAGKWHRQVSLLSFERVEEFNARGAGVKPGAFGENLLVEGWDLKTIPVGTKFRCNDVLLERAEKLNPDKTVEVVQNRIVGRRMRSEMNLEYGGVVGGAAYLKTEGRSRTYNLHWHPSWSIVVKGSYYR